MKIDAHQHFWEYNDADYPWISEGHAAIRRDFLPADLAPLLGECGVDGSIAVQARQTLEETRWLLGLAERDELIRGVVGWFPLCEAGVDAALERFAGHPRLVGARHVVHDEPDDAFILRDDFNDGVRRLARHGLVYDILIFERHLPNTIAFVDRHPEVQFVVDHIAKPKIREGTFDRRWRTNILELARRENVACKLSGMATEVDGETWGAETLRPYFETALEAFGSERLMFGSDWPVCLLMSGYRRWAETVRSSIGGLSDAGQGAVLGGNACRLYGLAPGSAGR